MKIFISWSGETSEKIAGLIKEFIPKVIQSAKPYYTPDDVEKGVKWEAEISQHLEKCEIGLICLTKNNMNKPWILFEAGALSNRLEKAKVCPILFGVKKTEITGPLSTFQMTDFSKEDFFKLIQSINTSLDEPVEEKNIEAIFNAFFTELENKVNTILEEDNLTANKSKKSTRADRDILEEILLLVRRQERRIVSLEADRMTENIMPFGIKEVLSNDYKKGETVYSEKFGLGKVINVKPDFLMIEFERGDNIPIRKLLSRDMVQRWD